MNQKRQELLSDFIAGVDDNYKQLFLDLAEYADALGYYPIKNKTKDYSIDFRNNKVKKAIMKMEQQEQKHGDYRYGERKLPGLRLKFFAAESYSKKFQDAIQNVIEEFGGKYTGCYGCGHCKGAPQGYRFIYPDGKKVFRCGTELISIFDFTYEDIEEMKNLLQCQAEYFAKSL